MKVTPSYCPTSSCTQDQSRLTGCKFGVLNQVNIYKYIKQKNPSHKFPSFYLSDLHSFKEQCAQLLCSFSAVEGVSGRQQPANKENAPNIQESEQNSQQEHSTLGGCEEPKPQGRRRPTTTTAVVGKKRKKKKVLNH